MKLQKPIKKVPAKPVRKATVDDADAKLTELFSTIAEAETRVQAVLNTLESTKEATLDKVFDRNLGWYNMLRQEVARDLVLYLQHTPIWETLQLNRAESPLGKVTDITKLYAEGWRYFTSVYENGKRVEIYHRPRMPETEAEFEKMFLAFFKRLKKDMNFQEEVKKPRAPDQVLTLEAPPPEVRKKVKLNRKK